MAVANVAGEHSLLQGAEHATPAAQKESALATLIGVETNAEELRTLQDEALAVSGADKEYSVDRDQEVRDIPLGWSLPPALQGVIEEANKKSSELLSKKIASSVKA